MSGGDCLTCSRVSSCAETSHERIRQSFVCPLFQGVPEPVYLARLRILEVYGESAGISALLEQEELEEEEEDDDDESPTGETEG